MKDNLLETRGSVILEERNDLVIPEVVVKSFNPRDRLGAWMNSSPGRVIVALGSVTTGYIAISTAVESLGINDILLGRIYHMFFLTR